MNNNKRLMIGLISLVVIMIIGVLFVTVFGNKKDGQNKADEGASVNGNRNEITGNINTHAGQTRSLLTGKWVDADTANNVPYAVMYSNIVDAMPQSSIGEADVVFESLVEGNITRLCCLFENKDALTKIGPVRSCRTYYLLFAKEFEAVYVHFGYSEYAEKYLAKSSFHSLDGMVYCDFYRTTDRIAPHNAYTTWTGITESAKEKKYPLTYPLGYTAPFIFTKDDDNQIIPESGQSCKVFYPGYKYNKPWFEYNEEQKVYNRFQFDGPQIDAESGEQLQYKNILVKYVSPAYYDNGTPNYKIYGNGKGIYITNGKAVNVTWVKKSETEGPTKYYYDDGSEVVLNQGKTYICQVETTQEVSIIDQ
jgi:hypothetical protein